MMPYPYTLIQLPAETVREPSIIQSASLDPTKLATAKINAVRFEMRESTERFDTQPLTQTQELMTLTQNVYPQIVWAISPTYACI